MGPAVTGSSPNSFDALEPMKVTLPEDAKLWLLGPDVTLPHRRSLVLTDSFAMPHRTPASQKASSTSVLKDAGPTVLLSCEAVQPPPGLAPPQGFPSHGSLLHSNNMCRPCSWFHRQGGCRNGLQCSYCHLCPDGVAKRRKAAKRQVVRESIQTAVLAGPTSHGTPKTTEGSVIADPPEELPEDPPESLDSDDPEPSKGLQDFDQKVDGAMTGLAEQNEHPLSLSHKSSECDLCLWFWTSSERQRGEDCKFSHVCTKDVVRLAKKITFGRLGAACEGSCHASSHLQICSSSAGKRAMVLPTPVLRCV